MLEYIKFILEKVSFDGQLFEKELKKSLKGLLSEHYQLLKEWCFEKFGKKYEEVLVRCFA